MDAIKGKAVTIASDMRVDSLGHSGLLGSGSTLDLDSNVVLDTHVMKVNVYTIYVKRLKLYLLLIY